MSPQEIDNYKKTLAHYLPPAAVDNVFDFLNSNSVYLHITRQRRTKLGDYRCIQRNHNYHEISVNGDLNPYFFLLVLIHEMAHLNCFLHHGNRVQPHGHEWQDEYRQLIRFYLPYFPEEVQVLLKKYIGHLPLNRATGKEVEKLLHHYDPDYDGTEQTILNELAPGTRFHIEGQSSHHFQSIEKRRTRWICVDLASEKRFLVSGTAPVVVDP